MALEVLWGCVLFFQLQSANTYTRTKTVFKTNTVLQYPLIRRICYSTRVHIFTLHCCNVHVCQNVYLSKFYFCVTEIWNLILCLYVNAILEIVFSQILDFWPFHTQTSSKSWSSRMWRLSPSVNGFHTFIKKNCYLYVKHIPNIVGLFVTRDHKKYFLYSK